MLHTVSLLQQRKSRNKCILWIRDGKYFNLFYNNNADTYLMYITKILHFDI